MIAISTVETSTVFSAILAKCSMSALCKENQKVFHCQKENHRLWFHEYQLGLHGQNKKNSHSQCVGLHFQRPFHIQDSPAGVIRKSFVTLSKAKPLPVSSSASNWTTWTVCVCPCPYVFGHHRQLGGQCEHNFDAGALCRQNSYLSPLSVKSILTFRRLECLLTSAQLSTTNLWVGPPFYMPGNHQASIPTMQFNCGSHSVCCCIKVFA